MNSQRINLTNQKRAALALLETQGGVTNIRFTRDGGPSGLGAPWAVNAVVTIEGVDYNEILGTEKRSAAGDPMPDIAPLAAPQRVAVTYSDGSSETLNEHG